MTELDCLQVKQDELNSAAEEWAKTPRVWVPNEKEGYALATIVGQKDSSGYSDVVLCETGEKRRVSQDDIHKVNPLKFHKCDDMAKMSCLNEPAVLYNMKQRYHSDLIYTYSGLFCVVINPYKQLKIYKDSIADCFKGRRRDEVPPHIFAVADEAYRNMLQNREDQSILCTGESGAGKTENTKKLIQYLAHVAGSRKTKTDLDSTGTSGKSFVGHLEEQLLYANPILEAFGNSKTIKNDNSSRFGKFVRIHFDSAGYISGANIEFYLLEKSRVLRQADQERSFHIFYQLISGASKSLREELLLESSPTKYRFLTNGDIRISGVDDKKELENTMDAMNIMGFTDDEIKAVFRVISALLLLGNLEFAPDGINNDQARITNDGVLQKVAKLLNVNFDDLQRAILKPKIKINRDHTYRSQNEEQARFSVEAIAKATYERLFRWLVKRLNRSLDRTRQNAATFIGILDIAGFEIYENNSFEQLCINYTNEKLQQLFNSTMFEREQQEYLSEGIEWNMINFGLDLQPTIDLIEKPLGVLAMLDDVCLFPGSTDASLVEKLVSQHKDHAKFISPEMRSKSDFGIVHYAGRVDYKAAEWRVKNMDPLNFNVVEVLQVAKDSLITEIWKDTSDMCKMNTSDVFGIRTKKGLFRTVSQLYKEQLSALMTTLNNTKPHFVRCIVPNHEKKAGIVNGPLVLEQLRCNGVLEGIRIHRQGFPNRIPFQEFRQRYGKLLAPKAVPHNFMDGREATKRIVEDLAIESTLYRIGQSKIFFRSGVVAQLENLRDEKLAQFLIQFQAAIRGSLARKQYERKREQANAIRILQRNGRAWMRLRNWHWWKLYTKVLPIVSADIEKERVEEVEAELKNAVEKLNRVEAERVELQLRVQSIEEERDTLQVRYDAECIEHSDVKEEVASLINGKNLLEEQLYDLSRQITAEEKKNQRSEEERLKLAKVISNLEERLAAEDEQKKKLYTEKKNAEDKLKDLEESKMGADESSARLIKEKQELQLNYRDTCERLSEISERKEDLERAVEKYKTELNTVKVQLQEANRKLITEVAEKTEELRKKHARELQEAKERAEDEAAARAKAEKAKQKVLQEYDDQFKEYNDLMVQSKDSERKQRRFDQLLAEEKNKTVVLQDKVYVVEQLNRDLESKLLSIQNELNTKDAIIDSLEKEKRTLSFEIESLSSNKDDAGKGVFEIEKAKRRLEEELGVVVKQMEDLEDELEAVRTEKQRMEIKYQAAQRVWERRQSERDAEEGSGNRQLKQKIRSLEEQLEDERRHRLSAASAKSKIEAEYKTLQDEISVISNENIRLKARVDRWENKNQMIASEVENWKAQHANELANSERMTKLHAKLKGELQACEEELANETKQFREARRQVRDLEEKIETLTRENDQLQTRMRTERRMSFIQAPISRNRYGSSTSLNRVDETLGSEDSPRISRQLLDDDSESNMSFRG